MRYVTGLVLLLVLGPSAEAGPFGILGPRHRARWVNDSAVVWQQPADWSYQPAAQAAPCPCDCGQPAAVAPLQQGPVNPAAPATGVQPMTPAPSRLPTTAPGT